MVKYFLQFVFIALLIVQAKAQTTYTVQPDGTTGMDAWVISETTPNNPNNYAPNNYGTDVRIEAARWTNGGFYSTRSFIKFDLSSISTSAVVCSAVLTFYTNSDNEPSGWTKSNACYLKKVQSAWSQTVITWNNQPRSYSESDKISFGPVTSTTVGTSYTVDVTSHVQNMINSPSTNNGWVFMLQDTVDTYAGLGFSSSNSTTPGLRPKLSVTYVSSLTVTPSATTICSGSSSTLTVSGGASSYSWTPSTGLSATTGTNVVATPTTTTIYTVTGTTGSCTAKAISTVTVNPKPSISLSSTSICFGSSGNLAPTISPSGSYTYSWTPSATLNSSTSASVIATPTTTTIYSVVATSTAGCSSTKAATVTVTGPVVHVNSATICLGSSAVLTTTVSFGSNYTWTPSSTLSSSTTASVIATPTSTTVYTVSVATGEGGCAGTATSTVTVNATPTLTVNSHTIAVCKGSSTNLTVTGNGTTYSWTPSTGLSATTGTAVTASPTVTTIYTITGTLGSCTATTTSTVTVNALPTLTISPTSSKICAGTTTTITASGASTYSWSPSSGLSTTTGTVVAATPTATTTYTITGTDTHGCQNTANSTVTLFSNPTITVNSATICLNDSATLIATISAGLVSWSPTTAINPTSGHTIKASPTVTTTYTVTTTKQGILGNPSCSSSATSTVTVNATPTITVNSQSICIRNSVTLTVTSNGTSYTWTPSAGLSATTGASVTATPTTTTIYTVVAALGSCTALATSTVHVNSPPVTVNSASILIGQSATLIATGGATYSWTPSTGLSATTGATVTATPSITTIYTVTGFSIECSNHATSTVTVVPDEVPREEEPPCYCVSSFAPLPGKKYLVSAWAREDMASLTKTTFTFPAIYIDFTTSSNTYISTSGPFYPSGSIIDGWQRIEGTFNVPATAYFMVLRLSSSSGDVLFDDIRAFPFDGSLKSYVYDPITMRLVAELDERNYATKYEYDEEGKLIHVKKETERGIMTITESRNSPPKK